MSSLIEGGEIIENAAATASTAAWLSSDVVDPFNGRHPGRRQRGAIDEETASQYPERPVSSSVIIRSVLTCKSKPIWRLCREVLRPQPRRRGEMVETWVRRSVCWLPSRSGSPARS